MQGGSLHLHVRDRVPEQAVRLDLAVIELRSPKGGDILDLHSHRRPSSKRRSRTSEIFSLQLLGQENLVLIADLSLTCFSTLSAPDCMQTLGGLLNARVRGTFRGIRLLQTSVLTSHIGECSFHYSLLLWRAYFRSESSDNRCWWSIGTRIDPYRTRSLHD
jgi:hypothetical protein